MQFRHSQFSAKAFLATSLLLVAFSSALANDSFSVKPAPGWVTKVVPSTETNKAGTQTTSSTLILDDEQIKVGNSVERYTHYVSRVENAAGLDDLSQLRFYFEPSYQQLTIHYVRIQRGGTVINALRPNEVKIIQQEDELDQQLYNGSLEAVIFLNDLRVGDIIDYAYTVTGENPVLGGKFVDSVYLAGTDPTQEMFLRLLFPTNRQLAIKTDNTTLEPTKQVVGSNTEYLWSAKNVDAINTDDATPAWYDPFPRVTFSEFQNWNDVVKWALPFYRVGPIKSKELAATIEEWKKNSNSSEERALAALRFIQDDIRYLGIELGRYSHQPTPPEQVFGRRFGDCKDKSLLLSTVLTSMGIEAYPALVSSYARSSTDSVQASPFAFDHVIVKAVINGKNYWFDPTVSYQRGGLNGYYDPPFERSLVIKDGENALEKIPVPRGDAGSIDVLEVYDGENISSPVSLTVTTTYRGMEADQMRYQLSTTSLSDLSKMYLNFYADTTPSISADGLPSVNDDPKTNTIVISERYSIRELWKQDRHRFYAEKIYTELQKPRVSQRSAPLAVHYPLSIKQTILVNIGGGFDFPVGSDVIANDALRFEYRFARIGNQLRMDFELKTLADVVPLDKLQEHLLLLDRAQEFVGFELTRSATLRRGVAVEPSPRLPIGLIWLLLFPGLALFVIWLVRRRSRQQRLSDFAPLIQAQPGTSPETALRVSNEEQLESTLVDYSCRCGHRPYDPQSPPRRERFTYDGQRLRGIQIQCGACKQNSDLYINVVQDNEPDGLTTLGIG